MNMSWWPFAPDAPAYIRAKVKYFTGARGELDFEKMAAYYGLRSADEGAFLEGALSARGVVVAMEWRCRGGDGEQG